MRLSMEQDRSTFVNIVAASGSGSVLNQLTKGPIQTQPNPSKIIIRESMTMTGRMMKLKTLKMKQAMRIFLFIALAA